MSRFIFHRSLNSEAKFVSYRFQKKKDEYDQLCNAGNNTVEDDIVFSRAQVNERARLQKLELDRVRNLEEIEA
jgi:hypothetical protein